MTHPYLSRRQLKTFIFGVAICAFVSGYAQPNHDDAPNFWNFEKFIHEGWILGRSRSEVVKKLGPPLQTNIEKVKNGYTPGQIDEIHHLFYDGAYVRIYKVRVRGKWDVGPKSPLLGSGGCGECRGRAF